MDPTGSLAVFDGYKWCQRSWRATLEVRGRYYHLGVPGKEPTSRIQAAVDELCDKTKADTFQLNEIKSKNLG